ncbi:MBL fold metallo-hydrolase [Falsibacillus pallidus]|uniref:MBL fold metallo-hydrolase n=1 Tax=Falsibacillus pallidus TaxID=493781 RepID=UPI001FE60A5D|nr:MBL fold metallo-hydrolase [Falsibacillus pallidus]
MNKINEGIFAAIAKDGGGAVGNAGFVDLGDKTIIFDTFNTQQAAEDLKTAAEKFTGRKPSCVINSHWHGDHIRGNQVFKDAEILSTHRTFEQMKNVHPERIRNQKDGMDDLSGYIKKLIKNNCSIETPNEKINMDKKIAFLKEIESSLPGLNLTLPTCTFQTEFEFIGQKRKAKLISFGSGHSICDSILYLPDDHTAFMGDLLFVETHPSFFEESNLENWIKSLEAVLQFNLQIAIPGHGQVGTADHLGIVKNYIKRFVSMKQEDSFPEKMPYEYLHWSNGEMYQQNIKMISEKALQKKEEAMK